MSAELADRIAAAVQAHPAVARLHAGQYGAVASYLPGRRVDGVRIAPDGSAIELAVVVAFGQPIPAVAQQLRTTVRELAGAVRVDVMIVDLEQPDLEQPELEQPVEQTQPNLEDSR